MNILQLTTRFRIGGIASYIQILSSGLKARGHQVFVAGDSGNAVSLLNEDGISFISLPLETKFEWHPKLWMAGHALERLIHEKKIDLVHAHTRVTQVLADRICAKLGIPFISTCHGFYPPRWGRRVFPCWGDRVIAISHEVGEHLTKVLRVDAGDVDVVLNAVSVPHLMASLAACGRNETREQWGFKETDFVLGSVARLEKVKGHAFLLGALEILKDTFPSLKLLIVGEGKERQYLEKSVSDRMIVDRVVFAGEMRDVTPALRAMDTFVSAHTWEEGFGLSIAEALVCGLPVIVSRTGALNRLIRDGETGMLVEAGNAGALAHAISTVVSDSALRLRIAGGGQVFARKTFSPERMAHEIERVYENVIARSAGGATKQSPYRSAFESVRKADSKTALDFAGLQNRGAEIASLATLARNDLLYDTSSNKAAAC